MRFIILFFTTLLFAGYVDGIYFSDKDANRYYLITSAKEKTIFLNKYLEQFLQNKKLTRKLDLIETGKKVKSTILLKKLKALLKGDKYTNTQYGFKEGIYGILSEIKEPLNLPKKVKEDINNSISSMSFFQVALQNDPKKDLENIVNLLDDYIQTLKKLNYPLLNQYNSKIRKKLLEYKIDIHTSIINALEIIKKYLQKNLQ